MTLGNTTTILRLPNVKSRTGLSRSTIYALIKDKRFPKYINLGARSVGWLESEVEGWIESRISASRGIQRIAGKADAELPLAVFMNPIKPVDPLSQ